MTTHPTVRTFHVHGMHCASCAALVEDRLGEAPGVAKVSASLASGTATIETSRLDGDMELARDLTARVAGDGYSIELAKAPFEPRWGDFRTALPLALLVIAAFAALQKAGLVNLIDSDSVSLPVAFGIGLIASLSTCLAVVGGLLLSISANYAKEDGRAAPHITFHAGRLAAFFVFGGAIGAVGSAFALDARATAMLSVLIALVMLALGLNLLNVFPWARRLQPRMPKSVAGFARRAGSVSGAGASALLGASTFFMPCGFTQSMQVYTLSTGGFAAGALTMTSFALGTLPVLALISATAQKLGASGSSRRTSVFFKTAGILVLAFALLNIANALAAAGAIPAVLSF